MDQNLEQLWKNVKQENVDGRWYVPRPAINQLVNTDLVSVVVRTNRVLINESDPMLGPNLQLGLINTITKRAKVTFAILLYLGPAYYHYIVPIINYGNSKGFEEIDHKLPLSADDLHLCKLNAGHIGPFCSAQWHFIAPCLQLSAFESVQYCQEMILPFRRVQIGNITAEVGAFGLVEEITIEPDHQKEPSYHGRVSRSCGIALYTIFDGFL